MNEGIFLYFGIYDGMFCLLNMIFDLWGLISCEKGGYETNINEWILTYLHLFSCRLMDRVLILDILLGFSSENGEFSNWMSSTLKYNLN